MRLWRIILIATLFLGIAAQVVAQSPAGPPAGTLAIVEGVPITADDVAAIVKSRGQAFSEDPAEAFMQALAALVAETVIEVRSRADGVQLNPAIAAAALDARRQVLFQYYAQSQFQPTPPTQEQIDAYIAENGHFFQDRVEYRFVRFIVKPNNATEVRSARDVLARVTSEAGMVEAALDALSAELAVRNIPFTRQLFWNGTEVIEAGDRQRLEAMRTTNRQIDIRENPGILDAIILLDARAAPVNPALLRSQIADRIVQEKFQAHLKALIAEISTPFLEAIAVEPSAGDASGESSSTPATADTTGDPDAAAVSEGAAAVQPPDMGAYDEDPGSAEALAGETSRDSLSRAQLAQRVVQADPSTPETVVPAEESESGIVRLFRARFGDAGVSLAGFGLFGFAAVFSALAATQWIRSAWKLRKGAVLGTHVEPSIAVIDHLAIAVLGAVAGALVLGLSAALVTVTLPWETRAMQLAVLGSGGATLGVLAGIVLAQSRPVDRSRPVAFGTTFAGGLAMLVTGAIATMI